MFIAAFMLNISGVMFTVLFILLSTGAIWLAYVPHSVELTSSPGVCFVLCLQSRSSFCA